MKKINKTIIYWILSIGFSIGFFLIIFIDHHLHVTTKTSFEAAINILIIIMFNELTIEKYKLWTLNYQWAQSISITMILNPFILNYSYITIMNYVLNHLVFTTIIIILISLPIDKLIMRRNKNV